MRRPSPVKYEGTGYGMRGTIFICCSVFLRAPAAGHGVLVRGERQLTEGARDGVASFTGTPSYFSDRRTYVDENSQQCVSA
jgi:hypothetical protein